MYARRDRLIIYTNQSCGIVYWLGVSLATLRHYTIFNYIANVHKLYELNENKYASCRLCWRSSGKGGHKSSSMFGFAGRQFATRLLWFPSINRNTNFFYSPFFSTPTQVTQHLSKCVCFTLYVCRLRLCASPYNSPQHRGPLRGGGDADERWPVRASLSVYGVASSRFLLCVELYFLYSALHVLNSLYVVSTCDVL